MLVLAHTFSPYGPQVSRGTDFVHPMLPFLLASVLSCSQAQSLIDNANESNLPQEDKVGLVEVIQTNTEAGCWDAND